MHVKIFWFLDDYWIHIVCQYPHWFLLSSRNAHLWHVVDIFFPCLVSFAITQPYLSGCKEGCLRGAVDQGALPSLAKRWAWEAILRPRTGSLDSSIEWKTRRLIRPDDRSVPWAVCLLDLVSLLNISFDLWATSHILQECICIYKSQNQFLLTATKTILSYTVICGIYLPFQKVLFHDIIE